MLYSSCNVLNPLPQRSSSALGIDGALRTKSDGTDPDESQPITIGSDRYSAHGNREIGGRTFDGMLYYAALCDRTLSAAEMQHNANLLSSTDDH